MYLSLSNVQVDYHSFVTLRDEDLQEMGITSRKDREKLLSVIARLSTKSEVHNCGDWVLTTQTRPFQFHSTCSRVINMGRMLACILMMFTLTLADFSWWPTFSIQIGYGCTYPGLLICY